MPSHAEKKRKAARVSSAAAASSASTEALQLLTEQPLADQMPVDEGLAASSGPVKVYKRSAAQSLNDARKAASSHARWEIGAWPKIEQRMKLHLWSTAEE